MQFFSKRTWRAIVVALVPTAALMIATPAFADRDGRHHGRWHHKEWRHHDRDHHWDRGHRWRHGHRKGHHWRHRHGPRVVIVKPRPRVYYVEPYRHHYYRAIPGVSGSVTFRF